MKEREVVPCIDGGPDHAWKSTGLDVIDDDLVATRRCVWCGAREFRLDGSRRRWKREVAAA